MTQDLIGMTAFILRKKLFQIWWSDISAGITDGYRDYAFTSLSLDLHELKLLSYTDRWNLNLV